MANPAIQFKSLCIIDGDSQQTEDAPSGILRLPGKQPELYVFNSIYQNLDRDLAVLTVSCQRAPEAQSQMRQAMDEIIRTNRDPHLLFSQLGIHIGFVSETIVRGAFIALWVRNNPSFCDQLAKQVQGLLDA